MDLHRGTPGVTERALARSGQENEEKGKKGVEHLIDLKAERISVVAAGTRTKDGGRDGQRVESLPHVWLEGIIR